MPIYAYFFLFFSILFAFFRFTLEDGNQLFYCVRSSTSITVRSVYISFCAWHGQANNNNNTNKQKALPELPEALRCCARNQQTH